MQTGNAPRDHKAAPLWGVLASVVACLLTLLMLVPLAPYMPYPGLDGSWNQAMNFATAEHLRFGKDIVFTFGPLASIYTRTYHPATDWMMLAGSVLIASAIFAGFFAATAPRQRVMLLLLPVVLSFGWGRDAVYLFVPVLLPFVVHRGLQRGKPFTVALCLLASAGAILLLVKGNFGLLLAIATVFSVLLCWRSSPRTALMIVTVELVAMIAAWVITGQQLLDLPGYFIAQLPIISGYTDAMSVVGKQRDLIIFMVAALGLLVLSLRTSLRQHWYAPPMLAAYLFVVFKSGFVRHDEHAFVAAIGLAFVGLLLCLTQSTRWRWVALTLALFGWAGITRSYTPVTWSSSTARFAEMVRTPVQGFWKRIVAPEALREQYGAITASFGARPPFAGYTGEADVYPVDLGALLGAGANWKPRPVLQSYSAYTPGLIRANAEHLANHPPHRVYFSVDTIDHRYPSLEDGASWLSLLGSFHPRSLDAGYAVLERADIRAPALRPVLLAETQAAFGEDVAVPGWQDPVWVTMEIRPTWIGKLVSTAYKAPKLSLRVQYENGESADFRLVSGMTETGFLLSPTVESARDFIALRSGDWRELIKDRRVKSLKISGDRGSQVLWKSSYRISFSRLDIAPSAEADRILLQPWQPAQQASSYEQGGSCNIDELDRRPVGSAESELPPGKFSITGWAAMDTAQGIANEGAWLLLTSADMAPQLIPVNRLVRPDVAAAYNQASLAYAGYEAVIDSSKLPARAQIRVVQRRGGETLLCPSAALSVRRQQDG